MKPRQMAAMLLASLLIVYPLSIGPVCRAYHDIWKMPPALQTFYEPLAWAYQSFPPMRQLAEWYVSLWTRHDSDTAR